MRQPLLSLFICVFVLFDICFGNLISRDFILRRRRKRDFWSQLWNGLTSGQGTLASNTNNFNIGPSPNGKDLGIGFGKTLGVFQGTGFDTGYTDGTQINAGAGNPGLSTGFGISALGTPVFNYGQGGNVDLQQGKVFAGTDIGAGKIIPSLFQQGTSVNFGGILSGINQMLNGANSTSSNSRIWNP